VLANLRLAAFGKLRPLLRLYAGMFVGGAIAFVGASMMIEMLYHMQLNEALGPVMKFCGMPLNVRNPLPWMAALVQLLNGGLAFELLRRRFVARWDAAQADIERELKRREAA